MLDQFRTQFVLTGLYCLRESLFLLTVSELVFSIVTFCPLYLFSLLLSSGFTLSFGMFSRYELTCSVSSYWWTQPLVCLPSAPRVRPPREMQRRLPPRPQRRLHLEAGV